MGTWIILSDLCLTCPAVEGAHRDHGTNAETKADGVVKQVDEPLHVCAYSIGSYGTHALIAALTHSPVTILGTSDCGDSSTPSFHRYPYSRTIFSGENAVHGSSIGMSMRVQPGDRSMTI